MTPARYASGKRFVTDGLHIVPLASLVNDPRFDPAANEGRLVQCDDGNRYHAAGGAWRLNATGGAVDGVTVVRDTEIFLQRFTEAERPSAGTNDRRMILNGDTGLPEISVDSMWRSMVDEARAAEIAQSVANDLLVVLDEQLTRTVGGPGADFATLTEALAWASTFTAANTGDPWLVDLVIQSAVTLAEQIEIFNVNLNFVRISSVDATVPVNVSAFTRFVVEPSSISYYFILGRRSQLPQINTNFVRSGVPVVAVGTEGTDWRTYGYWARANCSGSIGVEGGNRSTVGFHGFSVNVRGQNASNLTITAATFTDAGFENVAAYNSLLSIANVTATGAARGGPVFRNIFINGSSMARVTGSTGGADVRSNGSSTQPVDIVVAGGGLVSIGPSVQGGFSQTANVTTSAGVIFSEIGGPAATPLQAYTVATLPSAAANLGAQVYVSNGAGGQPVVAFSNGSNWLRCDTRAAVSSS